MEKTNGVAAKLELIIAILLGVTAVLTAWASWQASLYGGNQATKYTKSNSLMSEANAMYNAASQQLAQDMSIWGRIADYMIDYSFAEEGNDQEEMERIEWKLNQLVSEQTSEEYEAAITWAMDHEDYVTPFEMEGYTDSYFADYTARYNEAEAMLEDGQKDNALGDKLGLVTVIYAVVLFLLGITPNFDNLRTKYVLAGVSAVGFLFATIIMFTVPVIPLSL